MWVCCMDCNLVLGLKGLLVGVGVWLGFSNCVLLVGVVVGVGCFVVGCGCDMIDLAVNVGVAGIVTGKQIGRAHV